jgi:aldehyde oxidoreductase
VKNLNLKVNGVQHQFVVEEDMVLLDLLREELNLTGTKQGCDRKGQCGACTVIVNGKTVLSCLTKVANLDGAEVLTVEGLGTPDNPHLIQEAFVLSGAIQCGYCTPGMIMATKFLLDKNPAPDIQAIKKALTRTLCRCTGYTKIIDAVKLAGRFLRGETTPEKIRNSLNKKKLIGESHPRPSAMLKACGLAEFTADIKLNNALELAVVHSTEYHANIKSIDVAAAKKMPGVAGIMTAKDIKGTNHIPYSPPDQLVLCEDKVRTLGDPIAIVAAETRDQARAAAAAVKVEYERLPVMMTPAEALAPGAYQIHRHSPQNIQATQQLIKGDAGKALKEAKAIVEAEFSTQTNHQAPLEPEASVAYLEGEGKEAQLVVIGRSIDIHTHAGQIKEAVGWDNIRYKEAYVGGQFGIKLTITTEAIAAAAALHFKRPVRYIPSLTESMLISSKRGAYPSQKLKIAADASGHITAFCTDLVIDKGAYTLWGTACSMDRSFFMLSGAYNIPSIEAIGRTVFTNNASSDAARGAGPPESNFPLESIVDMLAEKMGIDPLEFRRMNSLKPGQSKATGTVVSQWPFVEVCDAMKPYYERAKREAQEFNAKGGKLKRGVGLGANAFGIGDGGDAATMTVEIDPDGGITIFAAVADPGEGNDSMLTQIAAHKLGLPLEKVRLYTRDTDKTVAMGPAAGSRMTLMAGNALLNAIENLQNAMKEAGVKTLAGLKAAGTPARYEGSASNPGPYGIDPKTGQGNSFTTDVQNLQMAEVEVNTETGETRVLKMTTVVDAGTVINPQAFEGQLEGGMDQGVGFALREEYVHGKTKDWITFKFPTIRDHFDIEIITLETPRSNGPLGAIGVGEMTMVSTAPAVINAIKDACGVRIYDLPATPEKVRAALAKHKE